MSFAIQFRVNAVIGRMTPCSETRKSSRLRSIAIAPPGPVATTVTCTSCVVLRISGSGWERAAIAGMNTPAIQANCNRRACMQLSTFFRAIVFLWLRSGINPGALAGPRVGAVDPAGRKVGGVSSPHIQRIALEPDGEAGGRSSSQPMARRGNGLLRIPTRLSSPVIPIQVPALHRFRQMFRRHTFGMIQICNRPRHAQHPVMRPRR